MLEKIITGGQTGVDRAALDAAMACGFSVGGWCPRGRRAEDGAIDERYPLTETKTEAYEERTRWNVRDSDATLAIVMETSVGGTRIALEEARQLGKPVLSVQSRLADPVAPVIAWIDMHRIRVLHIAGSRESEDPGIYEVACSIVKQLLSRLGLCKQGDG